MGDDINLGILRVACGVIVTHQLRALDYLVNERGELHLQSVEGMSPVVGERVHGNRLVLGRPQVETQLLNHFPIRNLEDLVHPQAGRLHPSGWGDSVRRDQD